ncbi:unnamed protein product [Urochloa decumbens]|uniref:Calcium-transporting ATPase n=1 Tax=Urochloa decumbens TaxID=240449 RepID=A0ABC8XYH9_9POAL
MDECADYLMIAVRRSAGPPWWTKKWRKAVNVIRTCVRLARLSLYSAGILGRAGSYVAIKIHDDAGGSDYDTAAAPFSVAYDDPNFWGLVQYKRLDCFQRLGGGAGIAAALSSGAEFGIRGDDINVCRRRQVFGANTHPRRKPKRFWRHVLDALSDVFLVVLLVCAAVSLGLGIKEHGLKDGWYDGVSILVAVLLIAAVSAVVDHDQAKRFNMMATECDSITVTVVRGRWRREAKRSDVVVGDVVALKVDDIVPSDGVFLEGLSLRVNEWSMMADEPHTVEVDAERNPFLASGVKVINGHGQMLVTAVGTETAWGQRMSSLLTTEKADPTPLQRRLEGFSYRMGKVRNVFAVLTALYFAGSSSGGHQGGPLMVKEQALVHTLSACETMGSVTTICAGMLRLNQMKVTEFWVGTDRPRAVEAISSDVVRLLCQGAGLNTTGSVYRPDNASPPEISGSPTEKGLLSWAVEELGMDADALKRSCKVVQQVEAAKERSAVMIRDNATGAVILHYKGDAEMILANCSTYVGADGADQDLGFDQRRNLQNIISGVAAASHQCIAFAYKQVDGERPKIDDEGLKLLGFVGLKDDARMPEFKRAIEACTKAGVGVKMVTGYNVATARTIAKECGIISSESEAGGVVIEGHEFRAMWPDRQLEIVDRIRVMARALPMDKLLLVQRLKQKGHVVAVTGDGTNDAPALKEADIGLSMGVEDAEVAKESSDIVILNGSFDTVVTAISWGRCIYNNIQKFIQFQLTVNTVALFTNFVSAVTTTGGKMPLTTVQLLWVNLIIDTMGALALATDTPTRELMRRRPIDPRAPLISYSMWRNLASQAAFQVAMLLAMKYRGCSTFGTSDKANDAMISNAFVLCQVFNAFNAREIDRRNAFAGVLQNRVFLAIVAVTIATHVVMVEVLTRFTGTVRLSWEQWGACAAIAAMSWLIGWGIKFIPVSDTDQYPLRYCTCIASR